MPLIAAAVFALFIGFEQLIEAKNGPLGLLALVILVIGFKAKSLFVTSIGACALAVLLVDSF